MVLFSNNLENVKLQLFYVLKLLHHKSLYYVCIFAVSSIKQNEVHLTYYRGPIEKWLYEDMTL